MNWDEAYRNGDYQQIWDYSHPSQELAANIVWITKTSQKEINSNA